MNVTEALKALYDGKRIRRTSWETKETYEMKADKVLTSEDLQADDWEVVDREDILSKKEKECLNSLLSLYLDNCEFVFVKELMHEQYFLKVFIFPWDTDKKAEHIYLPLSTTNGDMFSELEEHHLYTADDLGLFRE